MQTPKVNLNNATCFVRPAQMIAMRNFAPQKKGVCAQKNVIFSSKLFRTTSSACNAFMTNPTVFLDGHMSQSPKTIKILTPSSLFVQKICSTTKILETANLKPAVVTTLLGSTTAAAKRSARQSPKQKKNLRPQKHFLIERPQNIRLHFFRRALNHTFYFIDQKSPIIVSSEST